MNSDLPDPVTPSDEPAAAVPAPQAALPEVAVPAAQAETTSAATAAPVVDATAELKALFPALFTGKPKPDESDEVQLCAQAMCLEEMLDVTVPRGALFYGLPRRRM